MGKILYFVTNLIIRAQHLTRVFEIHMFCSEKLI
jgi:hypothetical protein